MTGLSQLERLHRWTLDERRRQATEIDRLIDQLNADIMALDQRVLDEIEAARGQVELERALPSYRGMMHERRERMERSIVDLKAERDRLQEQIEDAFNELKKTEQALANRAERKRQSERRKEQAISDEIGQQQHRRR